jgi:undecaprenyl phosphate-alpha-L-ara4FN deformylase
MSRILGLRIDVDTHEGMRDGVPKLLEVLGAAEVKGSFYFAMGPDRSGLAIVNVFTRPGFLKKMLKSGAPKIYSLRTMLSGTLLPARPVATAFPDILRRTDREGHETGVHAWDHRRWQDRLPHFRQEEIVRELERGAEAYTAILARSPRTFAAPAWFSCDDSLLHQETMALTHASDCRGTEPFYPVIEGRLLITPQVPATLPTLDETLGGIDPDATAFFTRMLGEVQKSGWPVLTIHAELEGGPFAAEFSAFLAKAKAAGIRVVTLKNLLDDRIDAGRPLPCCAMSYGAVEGRHGLVSIQQPKA